MSELKHRGEKQVEKEADRTEEIIAHPQLSQCDTTDVCVSNLNTSEYQEVDTCEEKKNM